MAVVRGSWTANAGKNCFVGTGAERNIEEYTFESSVEQCQERCEATDGCNCVVHDDRGESSKPCHLRENCLISDCQDEAGWNTYYSGAEITSAPTSAPTMAAVHCAGEYSAFEPCSASCGDGVKVRTFTETTAAAHGGNPCTPEIGSTDEAVCNEGPCPSTCTNDCFTNAPCRHNNDCSCVQQVDSEGAFVETGTGTCSAGTTELAPENLYTQTLNKNCYLGQGAAQEINDWHRNDGHNLVYTSCADTCTSTDGCNCFGFKAYERGVLGGEGQCMLRRNCDIAQCADTQDYNDGFDWSTSTLPGY
jgi:hypothetical protein